jgi:hypothetical protein
VLEVIIVPGMFRLPRCALVLILSCNGGCKSGASDAAPSAAAPSANEVSPSPAAPKHGEPPAAVAARSLVKLPDGRAELGPFSMQVPADWKESPSESNMRVAEFKLTGPGNAQAEVIVYYFGAGGAGDVDANVERWVSQFKQPDGKPSREVTKIETASFAGQEATLVSLAGRYVAAPPGGGEVVDKPDQALLAAIVPSPRGPYYFRLIGDQAAVAEQAPRFRQALASLALR